MFVRSAATPYVLALLVAALISAALVALGLWRRGRPGAIEFSALNAGGAIWAAFYAFELLAPSLGGKFMWTRLEYIGMVITTVAWYLFARKYTGASQHTRPRTLAILSVVPAAMLALVFTNGYHRLVWAKISLITSGPFPRLLVVHGPFFWLQIVYGYALIIVGSFILLRAIYRYPKIYRRQASALMVAILTPWFANIALNFRLLPHGFVNPTPFAFAIGGSALAFALFRFRLLSLLPALLPNARKQIFREMQDGVVVVDPDSMVVEANPSASTIFGKSTDELVGTPVAAALGSDVAAQLVAGPDAGSHFCVSLGDGASARSYDVVTSSLGLRTGLKNGRLLVFRDITDARHAEEALRLTQMSVDNAADFIHWIGPDGRLLYVSDSTCRRLGYSREEMLGLTVFDLSPTITPETWQEHWRKIERAGSLTWESVHRTKAGELFPVEVTTNFIDHNGHKYNFVYARDITSRKESEEQLRQSQKMEAVGQLAGGIAHDFNNLLGAIIGYSDLILGGETPNGDSVREDVGEIKGAAVRAAGLTSQILAFSRQQLLEPRVIPLNNVLQDMERLLRRTLGEDIDLVFKLEPDLKDVEVDPHQMEQVLMNLAINARDAMPDGGHLTMETGMVDLGAAYVRTHPGVKRGSHVMLAVSDSGCGMTAEVKSRVFEPFFTTKDVGQGTGLGLSTVFGIVKQSGGSINVYSEPGAGSTFKVYLPPARGLARAQVPLAEQRELPKGGSETILVVEDDFALRQLVVRILRRSGYEVLEADSAAKVKTALESGRVPDLLVTDVMLPGGTSGRKVAEMLVEQHSGVRVLYMSGYAKNAVVHDGRLDEGIEFIRKPFTPEELVRRVRSVLDADRLLAS